MVRFFSLFLLAFSSTLYSLPSSELPLVLHEPAQDVKSCTIKAGLADSFILALSAQPGFCQTYGYEAGKPECTHLSEESYQAKHLSLHGLWPNQAACGMSYGYCGTKAKSNHCDYSALTLNPDVSAKLHKTMPSYRYGSCLERHEWYKHGSCQLLKQDDYFSLATHFTDEINQSDFGQFITNHYGEKVPFSALLELVSQTFGESNKNKISIVCKSGVLVDIFVQLPAQIDESEPLRSLIDKAPEDRKHKNSCPKQVLISNFKGE